MWNLRNRIKQGIEEKKEENKKDARRNRQLEIH